MKLADRVNSSEPLSQVIEIPDAALNAKLVAMNDNYKLTSLSRESFEAGSLVSQLDCVEPRKSSQIGPIVAVALCFTALAVFVALQVDGAFGF